MGGIDNTMQRISMRITSNYTKCCNGNVVRHKFEKNRDI